MFRLQKNGDIWYYTIDAFEKTGLVRHCFSTRRGGVSSNEFESMNLRFSLCRPSGKRSGKFSADMRRGGDRQ